MRQELQRLRSLRPELAKAIEIARGHGDLSENGDYDAAKEKSGMTEARIRDLESKLALADIIDPSRHASLDRVIFGVTVKIEDVDSGEKRELSIIGPDESDADRGWISCESPLGKALIGKEIGDTARVNLPGGSKEYEITEIAVTPGLFSEEAAGEA